MIKKITVTVITLLVALAAGFILTAPAQAAVNADSRIVAIDLPDTLNNTPVVIIYLTTVNGSITALTTKTENGTASVLVDHPSELSFITVKVGKKRVKVDNFIMTDLAPDPESYGLTLGCLATNSNGEQVVVRGDGTVYTPATGKIVPVVSVLNKTTGITPQAQSEVSA